MSKYASKFSYILAVLFLLMGSSCEEYLDKTVEADIQEKDVFSTFFTYQGFVETAYAQIINFGTMPNNDIDWNFGDDVALGKPRHIQNGNYLALSEATDRNNSAYMIPQNLMVYYSGNNGQRCVWFSSWHGIRIANIALSNLDELKDATDEERDVLEGQALFFRGYFHWEIMKQWGGIPYIDIVYSPDDKMDAPQLKFNEAADRVIADLQKALELLPVDWNNEEVGQLTKTRNRGRITKGIVLGMLTQVQLFTGSPLMNGVVTGDYSYNTGYCEAAAATAWELIKLANQGVYNLELFSKYTTMFQTPGLVAPEPGINKEIVWKPPYYGTYSRYYLRANTLVSLGGGGGYGSPTQNAVEWFETKDGLPIDDPGSMFNPMDPWKNRDPRLYFNIMLDREKIVKKRTDAAAYAQLYVGGRDRTAESSRTGFGSKKFMHLEFNVYDNVWGTMALPTIRMAEVYLYYAEAVNEAYGPMGMAPGANLTAVDAVNLVRTRAGMPNVNAKFTGSKEAFRERIRNERAVELIFEAKRRDDLRRWHVAHLDKHKDLYGCAYPQDHSYFNNRDYVMSIVFEEKHYWFPFPKSQVTLYDGWKQNPGW